MSPVTAPPTPGRLDAWLDGCEERLVHPGQVADHLRRSGWRPVDASQVELRYRRRFNEHHLGYSILLVATGLAALGAGSAGHVLASGLSGPVNRNALAQWLTVLACSLPFAVLAHRWAARVDQEDPVAVWSQPRRTLGRVLLWSSGVVGFGRLALYVGQLMGHLVGAQGGRNVSLAGGLLNVVIVISIALPVGVWAFSFLHRFDREDPTSPPSVRHRPQS